MCRHKTKAPSYRYVLRYTLLRAAIETGPRSSAHHGR
jgi:hypothetical protein